MLHLGPRTFDELSGEVVQNTAFVFGKNGTSSQGGTYYRLVDGKNCADKEHMFLNALTNHTKGVEYVGIEQKNFEKIPGSPIGYWVSENLAELLASDTNIESNYSVGSGLSTSDNNRFLRFLWEPSNNKISKNGKDNRKWFLFQKGRRI